MTLLAKLVAGVRVARPTFSPGVGADGGESDMASVASRLDCGVGGGHSSRRGPYVRLTIGDDAEAPPTERRGRSDGGENRPSAIEQISAAKIIGRNPLGSLLAG